MARDFATRAKWLTVETLQQLLQDPKLLPTDRVHTRTLANTGDLPIERDKEPEPVGLINVTDETMDWYGETDRT